jgi:hypothetical protein
MHHLKFRHGFERVQRWKEGISRYLILFLYPHSQQARFKQNAILHMSGHFRFLPSSLHSRPPLTSHVLDRRDSIVYCDGSHSPQQNAGCDWFRTSPCCTDSTHLATCKESSSSKWQISTCPGSCGYDANTQVDACI